MKMIKLNAKQRLRANEELTPKQKQLDVNGDGEIDSTDLKKLREGEKPVKAALTSEAADIAKAAEKLPRFVSRYLAGLDKKVKRVLKEAKLNTDYTYTASEKGYGDAYDIIVNMIQDKPTFIIANAGVPKEDVRAVKAAIEKEFDDVKFMKGGGITFAYYP